MRNDGDLIRAKVTKITPDDIEYKIFNNLDGPLYVLPTEDIQKIDFENGTVQIFTESRKEVEVTSDSLKNLIIENINKYAYTHSGSHRYYADFQGDYLMLTLKNTDNGELGQAALYELDGNSTFHKLSVRSSGITYINVVLNQVYNESVRKVDTTRRFSKPQSKKGTKLVIRIKGHKQAEIIRDALIKYSMSFY